jgi:hypothetical protein
MSLQTEHAAAETSAATDLANATAAVVAIELVAATLEADKIVMLVTGIPNPESGAGPFQSRQYFLGSQWAAFAASLRALCDRLTVATSTIRSNT